MWPCIARKFSSVSSAVMSRPHREVKKPRNKGLPFTLINVILRAPLRNTRRGEKKRSDAREAEGAPLLREYRGKSSIEGSNPSHSASCEKAPVSGAFCFSASVFSTLSEGAFCLQAWGLREWAGL